MQSLMRTLTLGSLVAVLVPTASLPAQSADPILGTWKLNVAKSTYHPGPAPTSLTVTFAVAGKGVRVTSSGVDGEGKPIGTEYTASYDGKDYPATGSPDYDTVAWRRVDARTVDITRKKAGKIVQSGRRIVSRDGKQFTSITKGTNAKGQKLDNVALFQKQVTGALR